MRARPCPACIHAHCTRDLPCAGVAGRLFTVSATACAIYLGYNCRFGHYDCVLVELRNMMCSGVLCVVSGTEAVDDRARAWVAWTGAAWVLPGHLYASVCLVWSP